MFLLLLVNFVARENFVGKPNAQHIFTTTTTGPVVMQDVAGITGVYLTGSRNTEHFFVSWSYSRSKTS